MTRPIWTRQDLTHQFALDDAKETQRRVDEYFESLQRVRYLRTGRKDSDGEPIVIEEEYSAPPTLAGLALALQVHPSTLRNYRTKDNYPETVRAVIERAVLRMAVFWEEGLATREASSGAQFQLSRNLRSLGYDGEAADQGGGFFQGVVPPEDGGSPVQIPKWTPPDDE